MVFQKKLIIVLVVLTLLLQIQCSESDGFSLPVPKYLIDDAKSCLNQMKTCIVHEHEISKKYIRSNNLQFAWSSQQRQQKLFYDLYQNVFKVDLILTKIEQYLQQKGVNNYIEGNNNRIMGKENIVIGNSNQLKGQQNWIIQKDNYHATGNNFLIYQDWAIDMSNRRQILTNPWKVIKEIDLKSLTNQCTTQNRKSRSNLKSNNLFSSVSNILLAPLAQVQSSPLNLGNVLRKMFEYE